MKTYSELIKIPNYEDRFYYLKIPGRVGEETFGFRRYLNQVLYASPEWKRMRKRIIERDNGCDMACEGYDIYTPITIHHIEPITYDDIVMRKDKIFDPENLVCVRDRTHKAIHYGDVTLLWDNTLIVRRPNDTCPWK